MLSKIKQEMQKMLSNIRTPFRGVLNGSDSSNDIQRHQVSGLADETLQDVEIYQHFGFTSNPPPGTKVIVVPLNGLTSHSVIIATENGNYRLASLKPGEVALYSSFGSTVVLKEGNIIDIDAEEINFTAKKITSTADEIIRSADSIKDIAATIDLNSSNSVVVSSPVINLNGALTAGGGGISGAMATINMPLQFNQIVYAKIDIEINGRSFNLHTHPTPAGESNKPS